MLEHLKVSPRYLDNLEARIRSVYAPRPARRRLGSTPVDIEQLLRRDDDDPYFPQLHYTQQYDGMGYPQLRHEFVDYLEAALDAQKTRAHLARMSQLAHIAAAMRWCAHHHPASFAIYSLVVLDGKTVMRVADEAEVREVRILRMVAHARRVIDDAYERSLAGDLVLPVLTDRS